MKTSKLVCLICSIISLSASGEIDRSWSLSDEEIDRNYGLAAPDRGAKSQHDALRGWLRDVSGQGIEEGGQRISLLGRVLAKTSDKSIFQVPERVEVYDAAQAALLAIPGHAEYYRDRILDAQRISRGTGSGMVPKTSMEGLMPYPREQDLGFQTLEYLPSVETIRVLGEFLADGSDRPPPPGDDAGGDEVERFIRALPNCDRAAWTLVKLLANPPIPADSNYVFQRDLPVWRAWYEQIKFGNRTFRFKEDPTEYDLNGPAPKEKLERITRDQKRDAEREASRSRTVGPSVASVPATASETSKSTPYAMFIAGLFLLAATIWYFIRRKSHIANGQTHS